MGSRPRSALPSLLRGGLSGKKTRDAASYPPLEGEGRSHRTKRSFVRSGRGGVNCSSAELPHRGLHAAHPTPARVAPSSGARSRDPLAQREPTQRRASLVSTPPGEGKKKSRRAFAFLNHN